MSILDRVKKIEKKVFSENIENESFLITEMKKIGIEKLPYAKSALKKFIDSKTMDFHYNKHYKGYVDKLNTALKKKNFGDLDLEEIVKKISKFNITIRNNAGGAYNHALFWKMLSPKKQTPGDLISNKIKKDFGSYVKFKNKFEEVAKDRFGSGWVWLIIGKNNKLKIVSTPNQDNPLMDDSPIKGFPILGLDLWEHAYYLKYQNKRDEYIKNFWDVVNWEFVEKLYKMKLETKLQEHIALNKLNNTLITEQEIKVAEYCAPNEEDLFKKKLKESRFKSLFSKKMNDLLKTLYPKNWKDEDEINMSGVYHLNGQRSLLNNLTSSYSSFCILHKAVNKYLSSSNDEIILFGQNELKDLEELQRFFDVLHKIKDRLFNFETSQTYKHIGKILKKTDCLGKRNEDAVEKIINLMWDNASCELKGGLGLKTDAHKGIDAVITLESGKSKTAQIKPFRSFNEELIDNIPTIKFEDVSNMSAYRGIDLLIFINFYTRKVFVLENKLIQYTYNSATLPKNSLIKELTGDPKIKLLDCSEYL